MPEERKLKEEGGRRRHRKRTHIWTPFPNNLGPWNVMTFHGTNLTSTPINPTMTSTTISSTKRALDEESFDEEEKFWLRKTMSTLSEEWNFFLPQSTLNIVWGRKKFHSSNDTNGSGGWIHQDPNEPNPNLELEPRSRRWSFCRRSSTIPTRSTQDT